MHFDTYATGIHEIHITKFFHNLINYFQLTLFIILDSTNLEIFLENLYDDSILIALTSDESTTQYLFYFWINYNLSYNFDITISTHKKKV